MFRQKRRCQQNSKIGFSYLHTHTSKRWHKAKCQTMENNH